MIKKLKYLFFSVALLSNIVFFTFCSLVGLEFEGSDSNSAYIYFCLFLFAIVSVFVLIDFKKCKNRKLFLIPFFFIFIYFIESSLFQYSWGQRILLQQSFKCFCAFSIPCIFIGINLANTKSIERIYPWVDVLAVFIALGCLVSLPRFLTSGLFQYGGSNYQQLSYNAAFAFSILLYNLLFNNRYRFRPLSNKLFSCLSFFLMLGCIICILSSGGRGGFVLLLVDILYVFYLKGKDSIKSIIYILITVLIIVFLLYFLDLGLVKDLVDFGYERIFNTFFSHEGSAISRGGRDEVFNLALRYISENPFGYGFFRSYALMGNYPHNIILEILMDGGFLLLLLFICFIVKLIIKLKRIGKEENQLTLFMLLFFYPIVMLSFTGTYLWNGMFWFCVVYILSYRVFKRSIPD